METNNSFNDTAYEAMNATSDLRLHMEAIRALFLLMEHTYFEPRAEHFVECLTVSQWEQIQHNIYTLTDMVDAIMKECRAVEDITERLYERTKKAQ